MKMVKETKGRDVNTAAFLIVWLNLI